MKGTLISNLHNSSIIVRRAGVISMSLCHRPSLVLFQVILTTPLGLTRLMDVLNEQEVGPAHPLLPMLPVQCIIGQA